MPPFILLPSAAEMFEQSQALDPEVGFREQNHRQVGVISR